MRLSSGTTDQYIYFVAVDITDLKTRETGLSGFTVYRSRNGAASAQVTTPTVNETDATNMPGVYEFLVDEDTTIAAGNSTEEIAFHITHASMAPVTRTIELFVPPVSEGETLGVSGTGSMTGSVASVVATVSADVVSISGDATAADNLELDYDGTGYAKANSTIGTCTTNTDMRGTDSAATAAALATAQTDLDTITGSDGVTLATAQGLYAPSKAGDAMTLTAAGVDLIWDETMAGHVTADTSGLVMNDWQDGGRLDVILDARMAEASISTTGGAVDAVTTVTTTTTATNLTNLPTIPANWITAAGIAAAAITDVEFTATGTGLNAIPWNAAWDTEVESEVNDALDTAISELGVAAPTATPTIRTGLMLLYMMARNKLVVQTSGTDAIEVYNNAGTKITQKLITDAAGDYTEAEMG